MNFLDAANTLAKAGCGEGEIMAMLSHGTS
jgi:hypothetical protein